MNIEIWRDIPGFEKLYQVSDRGRVKSLGNGISTNKQNCKERIMKTRIKKTGYEHLKLCKEGKYYYKSVHQLVAMAFLSHKPNGNTIVVDHINNIKHDNRLVNLQLLSNRENVIKNIDKTKTTSKYMNISYNKKSGKWALYIKLPTGRKYIGQYETEEEAHEIKIKITNGLRLYDCDRQDT